MVLTAVQTVLLLIFGMDFIDALSHSFATLGTGGFSTRNASVGSYNSVSIDIICTIFMFLAGINFSLFFYAVTRKFDEIRCNSEFKCYIFIVLASVVAIAFCIRPCYASFASAFRSSAFQTVSIITTTGFGTADYTLWPSGAQFFVFLLFFIGGCSGSTGAELRLFAGLFCLSRLTTKQSGCFTLTEFLAFA